MRAQFFASACAAAFLSLALAACSGGFSNGTSTGGTGSTGGTVSVANLSLQANTPQLPSAAIATTQGVTISAVATDKNNNFVPNATITFATSAGGLTITSATTDASGVATAILTTNNNQANQTITVNASGGGATAAPLTITESGTTLSASGPSTVSFGGQVTITVKVVNSSGTGISGQSVSAKSANGNTITPTTATTNAAGQASFTLTGSVTDTLTFTDSALNASNTLGITVASSVLSFSTPAVESNLDFNVATPVEVNYAQNGTPVPNATINFSTSRGTLSAVAPALPCVPGGSNVTSLAGTTDAAGNATVYLCSNGSNGAGGLIFTAAASNGPSASLPLQFLATTPNSVSVEATPSTIAPSATSTISATVRDASNNLVDGATVVFTLSDPTGGSLSSTTGTTDATGSTSVTYQATAQTSAQNGVVISANVQGTSIDSLSPAEITVGGEALRIILGTGNTIGVYNATEYQKPYSVLVTDSAGAPVPGATFNLQIQAIAYQKGHLAWNGTEWAYDLASLVPNTDPDYNSPTEKQGCTTQEVQNGTCPFNPLYEAPFGCTTEDPTNAGIYSVALDYNHNGVLDPGGVASVPSTVALDATGSGQFQITYPKDHALWVEVLLTGTATVAGTETTAIAVFPLVGLASDYTTETVAPPGQTSPYGDSANPPPPPIVPTMANNCQAPD